MKDSFFGGGMSVQQIPNTRGPVALDSSVPSLVGRSGDNQCQGPNKLAGNAARANFRSTLVLLCLEDIDNQGLVQIRHEVIYS